MYNCKYQDTFLLSFLVYSSSKGFSGIFFIERHCPLLDVSAKESGDYLFCKGKLRFFIAIVNFNMKWGI